MFVYLLYANHGRETAVLVDLTAQVIPCLPLPPIHIKQSPLWLNFRKPNTHQYPGNSRTLNTPRCLRVAIRRLRAVALQGLRVHSYPYIACVLSVPGSRAR